MAEFSKIEWCDATWNPWVGCTKISSGCTNCYMFRDQKRFGHDPSKIRRTKRATFNAPLKWTDPKRIFVCSWSDFFHHEVPESWREDAYKIMADTPHHTYMLLTKRPELMQARLPTSWFAVWPKHIEVGVTVESQRYMNRMSMLYHLKARTFVSAEPLLGPLDFSEHMGLVDWVIVGGESGANARYMHPDWARDIRDQCREHGVPFFMKQMTKKKPIPDDLMIREFPDAT